jgi:hypothetical protein
MNRSEKTEAVAALNATFNEAAVVVVTRNLGSDRRTIDRPSFEDA